MDWFLALNEGSLAFDLYCDLARVAVESARTHTSLRPNFIYDGNDNPFTDWLRGRGVRIFRQRSFLADELEALGKRRKNPMLPAISRGAFLRMEVPEIARAHGLSDRVLYTDCDVLFRSEVVPELDRVECHLFAVAPEFDRADFELMNSGVMLMNAAALEKSLPDFQRYLREQIEVLPAEWDQGAYRRFYRDERGVLWDRLPPELNWKPYWGDNEAAKIVHFHGPKPFHRGYFDSHFPELKHLSGGAFPELAAEWDEWLLRTR